MDSFHTTWFLFVKIRIKKWIYWQSFRRTPRFSKPEGCRNLKCWWRRPTFLSCAVTPPALSIKLCWLQGAHFQLGQIARSRAHPHFTKFTPGSTSEMTMNTFTWVDPLQLSHLAEMSSPPDLQSRCCRFWKRTWDAQRCFYLLDPKKGWFGTSKSPDAVFESCKWEGMELGTDSSPCRSPSQGKAGQDGEGRDEGQLKLLPTLVTARPFCLRPGWGLVLQGKIPDALLIYVRVCWPDTVSWENRLWNKGARHEWTEW